MYKQNMLLKASPLHMKTKPTDFAAESGKAEQEECISPAFQAAPSLLAVDLEIRNVMAATMPRYVSVAPSHTSGNTAVDNSVIS